MLEGKGLTKLFPLGLFGRKKIVAVENVDIQIERSKTSALIGESGSGKSTLAKILTLLINPTKGDVFLDGEKVTTLKGKKLRNFRKRVQMIPQHPEEALDPRWKILKSIVEPAKIQKILNRDEYEFAVELLEIVGLKEEHLDRYPRELSGGELQRIVIARALSLKPDFLICDEPTSMLDVSIQASIIRLLLELQRERKLGYLFITHDIELAKAISEKAVIMLKGEVVEICDLNDPLHPYTKLLLSLETPDIIKFREDYGCKFFELCKVKLNICDKRKPDLIDVGKQKVRCHLYGQN